MEDRTGPTKHRLSKAKTLGAIIRRGNYKHEILRMNVGGVRKRPLVRKKEGRKMKPIVLGDFLTEGNVKRISPPTGPPVMDRLDKLPLETRVVRYMMHWWKPARYQDRSVPAAGDWAAAEQQCHLYERRVNVYPALWLDPVALVAFMRKQTAWTKKPPFEPLNSRNLGRIAGYLVHRFGPEDDLRLRVTHWMRDVAVDTATDSLLAHWHNRGGIVCPDGTVAKTVVQCRVAMEEFRTVVIGDDVRRFAQSYIYLENMIRDTVLSALRKKIMEWWVDEVGEYSSFFTFFDIMSFGESFDLPFELAAPISTVLLRNQVEEEESWPYSDSLEDLRRLMGDMSVAPTG